jgi:hypothetical protein
MEEYEYAGFIYIVQRDAAGSFEGLKAKDGQHRSAYKQRHLTNAEQCYRQDFKIGRL